MWHIFYLNSTKEINWSTNGLVDDSIKTANADLGLSYLEVDMETTENINWVATLGNLEYYKVGFSPSISNGYVLIGTNNVNPRDKDKKGESTHHT